jgi:acetyl esterase
VQLNRQAADFLKLIAGAPPLESIPVQEHRQREMEGKDLTGERTELAAVDDVVFRTNTGDVRVRVYRPSLSTGLPVVAFAHGGAWAVGNLDTHDHDARDLAARSGAVVVAIDYRLAPEHPFPAGLDDCVGVVRRLLLDGGGLGVDVTRVAVYGESSGGNLLAAACQQLKGEGVVHQILVYPSVDATVAGDNESYRKFGAGYFLATADIVYAIRRYAGDKDPADPHISPSRAGDLSGLPPATILTAEYDALRDEAEDYAARLSNAGVPTNLRRFPGQIHGFVHFAGAIDDGKIARKWLAEQTRLALKGPE